MLRTFWKAHRFVLTTTGGRLGSRLGGMQATATVRGPADHLVARELEGAEREAIFVSFAQADDSYGVYRDRTSREIPVIELRPEED
jgi:hypothetical protein